MKELESVAKEKNYQRMFLTVAATNKHAIAFYEHLGWAKAVSSDNWDGRMVKDLALTTPV
jgi:hypothetical protein